MQCDHESSAETVDSQHDLQSGKKVEPCTWLIVK